MVGEDLNVILGDEKKIDGLPVYPQKYGDFALCIHSCELYDINFSGIPFSWWNGRVDRDWISKILDRIVVT